MSTTHIYDTSEMGSAMPDNDPNTARRKAILAGYTNPIVAVRDDANGLKTEVTVDEDGVDKATLLAQMQAETVPSFTMDASPPLEVVGDGVSTGSITLTDSRGAAAAGKTMTLRVFGTVIVDAVSKVLDANGQAVFTFGPSPSAGYISPLAQFEFNYATGEGPGCRSGMRFVSA